MIKIILAEDHQIVRKGIRLLIADDPEFEILAEAANGQEALNLLSQYPETNIVVADLNMPVMDGKALIAAIGVSYPGVQAIILSMEDNPKTISDILKSGARGYLFKNADASELIFAIRFVASGSRYICSEFAFRLLESGHSRNEAQIEHDRSEFSSREMEVLNLIAEGYTNSQIADKLFVSKRTVEGHRQSLLEKTASKNTAMLIRNAINNHLI